jgi:uncharacterized protein YaeQ
MEEFEMDEIDDNNDSDQGQAMNSPLWWIRNHDLGIPLWQNSAPDHKSKRPACNSVSVLELFSSFFSNECSEWNGQKSEERTTAT